MHTGSELAKLISNAVPFKLRDDCYCWFVENNGNQPTDRYAIPAPIFALLPHGSKGGKSRRYSLSYDSRQEAMEDLKRAVQLLLNPKVPQSIDPLPVIKKWLETNDSYADPDRQQLKTWLEKNFPDTNQELAADALITVGIGRGELSGEIDCMVGYKQ